MVTEKEDQTRENEATARDIAFGAQQTFACWSTDAIDPPLSRAIQNAFGKYKASHKQVWYGEIIGDSAALFEFVAVKKLFRPQIDAVARAAKWLLNPLLDRLGHKRLKDWAAQHHLTPDDARYRDKMEEFKEFQAHNAVDIALVATGATLSNVAVQKHYAGRESNSFGMILLSKIGGAVATMALMFGLRTSLPTATQRLDEELSERYFSKLVRGIQNIMGVAPADPPPPIVEDAPLKLPEQTGVAAGAAAYGGMAALGGALGHFVMELEPVERMLGKHHGTGAHLAGIAAGGGVAIAAAHLLAPDSVRTLKGELHQRYFNGKQEKNARWSERVDEKDFAASIPGPRTQP